MTLIDPFVIQLTATATILLVLFIMRKNRLVHRISVILLLGGSAYLVLTKSPEEGWDDFRTADTKRILRSNHRILRNWQRESGSYPSPASGGLGQLQMFSSAVFYRDAWHRELRYELKNGTPKMTSAGADGRFGTEDDIVQ